MFAMILLFVNFTTGNAGPSQGVTLYPDKESCEAELHDTIVFQQGKHAGDGFTIGGYCLPTQIRGQKTS